MIIVRLALSGLRHRTGAFVATFLSATLGAAILMTFAALLDTAAGPSADAASRDPLTLMASVVGGWSLIIVVFAVSSTMSLSVRQRDREFTVLRHVGATPGQLTAMIVGEAVVVAVLAAVVATPIGFGLGQVLLDLLVETRQVNGFIPYAFGPIAPALGFGVTVLGSLLGALLAGRRPVRIGRGRVVAAVVFLLAGVTCGGLTATLMKGHAIDAMMTAGQAAVWTSLGLALLAPWLLRLTARIVPVSRLFGAAGFIAAANVRRQAATVMPLILFTGVSTATIAMQAIENGASAGRPLQDVEKTIRTLNYVVVGMITLFVAIMLVNTILAATAARRSEFARQRLAGATPAQTVSTVLAEGTLLTLTGVAFGALASLVTILPYGYVRTADWTPPVPPWLLPGVAALAVTLTLTATAGATARAIRGRPIDALA